MYIFHNASCYGFDTEQRKTKSAFDAFNKLVVRENTLEMLIDIAAMEDVVLIYRD